MFQRSKNAVQFTYQRINLRLPSLRFTFRFDPRRQSDNFTLGRLDCGRNRGQRRKRRGLDPFNLGRDFLDRQEFIGKPDNPPTSPDAPPMQMLGG